MTSVQLRTGNSCRPGHPLATGLEASRSSDPVIPAAVNVRHLAPRQSRSRHLERGRLVGCQRRRPALKRLVLRARWSVGGTIGGETSFFCPSACGRVLPLGHAKGHSLAMRRPGALGVILLLTLLSGCDAAGSRPAPAPTPPPSQSAAAEHTCAAKLAGNEIQGRGSPDTDLWGLLLSSYPLPRAEQVKIV